MENVDMQTGEIIAKVQPPFVRSAYNYDRDAVSLETGAENDEPSMAKQSFAEEADINTIVRRFGLTGELPTDVAVPQSGDFENAMDFHSAMNVVRAAEEAFMELPAEVRYEFANDPGRFLAFVHDPANRDRAEKLGIVVPKPVEVAPAPIAVRVVADPPAGGSTSST